MSHSASPSLNLLRFLGRVQFTMLLLLGGAIAMIAGTLVESRSGFEAAQAGVYRTFWFNGYLFLIAVNLVFAVVNRIPIQRHQWAFVVTHVSVVLLLLGSWISANFGYEGKLAVREGARENRIRVDEAELRVWWAAADAREQAFALGANRGLAGRELRAPSGDDPGIRIEEFIPNGEYRVSLVDAGGAGGPGVELHLNGMGIHRHEWLIGDHRFFRRKDVGPVEIELLAARSPKFLRERRAAQGSAAAVVEIRLRDGEEPRRLELPGDLDRNVELGNGLRARAVRFLQRARVEAGGLIDHPEAPVNPAVVVEIRSGECAEIHTVFSDFPQFNLARGRDKERPLVAGVALRAVAVGKKPLVTILVEPQTEKLYVQLSAPIGRGEALPFRAGQTVGVGNLGLDLRVDKYLPSARSAVEVRAAARADTGEPWMRVVASHAGKRATDWLRFGSGQTLELDGRKLALQWDRRAVALPFTVALEEFEIDFHPGSRRPSQYLSRVRLHAPDSGETQAVVSMNSPLDFAGFRLFQTSYRLGARGQPDQTVLTVSYDPGVIIVYPACVLLILGVGWYLLGSRRRNGVAHASHTPASDAVVARVAHHGGASRSGSRRRAVAETSLSD